MGKNKTIHELTTLIAISLRHKIGSLVNKNEIYAQRYAKDSEILLREARKVSVKENWNKEDKLRIKEESRIKLRKELEERSFLDNSKFDLIDRELDRVLGDLGLG